MLACAASFTGGIIYEAHDARSELIAAQEEARKAGAAAVKREYDAALKAANDVAQAAVREAAKQARDQKVRTITQTIRERVRDDRCVFTPEDMRDINAAGHP